MPELKRVHVSVSGRVQGVFFRVECASKARSLGLAGFVRNSPDGRVEAAFEGEPGAVDEMVEWCRQGPSLALVESVEVTPEQPTGDSRFTITS